MDYWIVGLLLTCIFGLIAIIYDNLVSKINKLDRVTDKNLFLKVDKAEYKIAREWQQDIFEGLKVTIKELKDENNEAHKGILFELKKNNR